MTTNTTKIAEAISLLSTVLSSEVAQINHPFDNEEETDSLEDYDDLKELAEDYANELNNDLEKTNNVELMRGDAEMATALQEQFNHIPFPTPFVMMG